MENIYGQWEKIIHKMIIKSKKKIKKKINNWLINDPNSIFNNYITIN